MKTPFFWLCLIVILGTEVLALEPAVTKLVSRRADGNTGDDSFGVKFDGTDRFLVVGEQGNSERGAGAGAAYLFDSFSGAFRRKLLAPDGVAGDRFGAGVAASGQIVLVGAPGRDGGAGTVYAFDAASGRLLGRLFATDRAAGDGFGEVLALEGNLAVVGVPLHDGGLGAVYLFDLSGLPGNLTEVHQTLTSPRLVQGRFGAAVSTDSNRLAVGAPGEVSARGGIYLFDLTNQQLVFRTVTGASTNDRLGQSVALSGRNIFAGAPGDNGNAGSVFIYDSVNGNFISGISGPSTGANDDFGTSVSAVGNLLVVGQPEENSGTEGQLVFFQRNGSLLRSIQAPDQKDDDKMGSTVDIAGNSVFSSSDKSLGGGVVYRFAPVSPPFKGFMRTIARLGDSAPGAGEGTFRSFGPVALGNDDFQQIMIAGSADHGKVRGLWDNENRLQPTVLSNQNLSPLPVGSFFAATFGTQMWNFSKIAGIPVFLRGDGVNRSNDQALLVQDQSGPLITLGTPLREGVDSNFGAALGVLRLGEFFQVVQPRSITARFSTACRFVRGVSGVTAADDSGMITVDKVGATIAAEQEGEGAPVLGFDFGEFGSLVAHTDRDVVYSASLRGPVSSSGLFRRNTDAPGGSILVARDGEPVFGGREVARIVGASIDRNEEVVYRALLRSGDVTSANDDALVRETSDLFPDTIVLRENDAAVGLPNGVVINRFLKYWAVTGGQTIALVHLRGPGVSRSNDLALLLADAGQKFLLIREGATAPGCDGSRFGTIQGVEVDADTGDYFVLASLTGSSLSGNQALFANDSNEPSAAFPALRRPRLELRKGWSFQQPLGGTASILSMSFGLLGTDSSGAGGKGLPTAVREDNVALKVAFSDRSVHVIEYDAD